MKVNVATKEEIDYYNSIDIPFEYENDYNTTVKAFEDKQSAINYLGIEKELMLQEVMEYQSCATVEELQHSDGIIDFDNHSDHYYINIEEWGYDYLTILEQDLMSFNI